IAKDSLKIAVVGDLTPEALGKLLDDTFGSLPARGNLTPVPEVAAVKPPQHTSAIVDVPQTSVNFGGPGIARNDPDFMAAYIVNHILGGGT
ncbi:insulinase family protein, partial [Acinetobacter baumannii]